MQAILLAAGTSNRFKTEKTKLIAPICGKEMITYPLQLLSRMNIPTTVVVGFQSDSLIDVIQKQDIYVVYVHQKEQQGTGHAVMSTQSEWDSEYILIMNGDMPLVTEDILESLYAKQRAQDAVVSIVIAHHDDPYTQYNRIKVTNDSVIIAEPSTEVDEDSYINTGIYIIKRSFLELYMVQNLFNDESMQEWHFSDIIMVANKMQQKIVTLTVPFDSVRDVNTMQDIWAVEQIKRAEIIKYWMNRGVRFTSAQTTVVDVDVTIEKGTLIGSGVHLLRGSTIGQDCVVDAFSIIENSVIADRVRVLSHSVINNSTIAAEVQVGPFAHIAFSSIDEKTIIGNFVEVNRTTIGVQTKAKHLTYLGDAHVGSKVNIGAGTITCNHNSVRKQKTIIEDNVYVGSNNSLVAPVTVGAYAFTAAGSIITDNVPAQALAIARSRQVNKLDYAPLIRARALAEVEELKKEQTPESCDTGTTFKGATLDHNSFI